MDIECPKCNKEKMFAYGPPPQLGIDQKSLIHMHKCEKCGHMVQVKGKRYPSTRYEPMKVII